MARDLLSSDGSDSEDASAEVQAGELKVNEEFARRFEYNKKREEMQRRTLHNHTTVFVF